MNTITISTNATDGVTLATIDKRDLPVCYIGLTLLATEVEKAKKALAAIGLDPGITAQREAEGDAIRERLGDKAALGLPLVWLPTLRVALALELDRVAKVSKAQTDLLIPTDETSTRSKQLDRLLSELEVAQMAEAAV